MVHLATYRRRLTRLLKGSRNAQQELARISKALRSKSDIVLVHTCGKVGSTAMHAAIASLRKVACLQTHFISPDGIRTARADHANLGQDPWHLHVGERIGQELAIHPQRPVKIVTSVRDPIARAISNLFENPELTTGHAELETLPMGKLAALAEEQVAASLNYMETWFDTELAYLLGDNLLNRPFQAASGFCAYPDDRRGLFVVKLESLDDALAAALAEFLGQPKPLRIPMRRSRSNTPDAGLYTQLHARLSLPETLVTKVYSSRLCRHFYSEAEIVRFSKRWKARS